MRVGAKLLELKLYENLKILKLKLCNPIKLKLMELFNKVSPESIRIRGSSEEFISSLGNLGTEKLSYLNTSCF